MKKNIVGKTNKGQVSVGTLNTLNKRISLIDSERSELEFNPNNHALPLI